MKQEIRKTNLKKSLISPIISSKQCIHLFHFIALQYMRGSHKYTWQLVNIMLGELNILSVQCNSEMNNFQINKLVKTKWARSDVTALLLGQLHMRFATIGKYFSKRYQPRQG